MITGIAVKNQTKNAPSPHKTPWQQALAQAIRDPQTLLDALELPHTVPVSTTAAQQFRVLAPWSYVQRMHKGDPNDPLLRQVLPHPDEMQEVTGYLSDPVDDQAAMTVPGVLHKYHGRVLLVTTGACAIHCRYCFRRHFPYNEANPLRHHSQMALDYIRADSSIQEVILSGGDPLTLSDERLAQLADALSTIPHVQRLRIHSRLPLVLPERVDHALLTWLSQLQSKLQVIIVLHANHAQELDASDVRQAMQALQQAGVLLLNQSVLLKGINDSVDALCALSEALLAQHILPYYLHVLDKVAGAAHFDTPEQQAITLIDGVRARLPGYMVPQLVREIAGETAKTPLPTI